MLEFTINLDLKLKQILFQLLQNDTKIFCSTRNVNNVATIKIALKNSLNCHRRHQKHVKFQTARMKKNDLVVQDFILYMDDFGVDQFDSSAPKLNLL